MYFNWKRYVKDLGKSFFPSRYPHLRLTGHRARVLVMLVLCMAWMGGSGRMGLWLDNLLFPWFRKAKIEKPVFIIGNFRSGSTFLHRMLAASRPFTALKTWELYFAPSIVQRRFWQGLWIVDGWFGGFLKRTILSAQESQLAAVTMHRIRLEEPEEDEAIFLYLWDSLFNWFFVPADAHKNPYWRFDSAVPRWRRDRAMEFYRGVLQRHMALQPAGSVYLSKSPAFTARIDSLRRAFPEARFIELVRDPEEVVVSAAAWFDFAWHFFASPTRRFPFVDTVVELVRHWFLLPAELERTLAKEQFVQLRFEQMIDDPLRWIPAALEQLGIPVAPDLLERLESVAARERKARTHEFSLSDLGLSKQTLVQRYREVYERLGYPT
jgi:omega-hydroxy-beta-dihydromenaquinone-9 sulfotransferase